MKFHHNQQRSMRYEGQHLVHSDIELHLSFNLMTKLCSHRPHTVHEGRQTMTFLSPIVDLTAKHHRTYSLRRIQISKRSFKTAQNYTIKLENHFKFAGVPRLRQIKFTC